MFPSCAETLASVSMQEMFTTATARWDTRGVIVRSRWMNVIQTLAKMEPPALTFWVDTHAR